MIRTPAPALALCSMLLTLPIRAQVDATPKKPDLATKLPLVTQAIANLRSEPSCSYELKIKLESQIMKQLGNAVGQEPVLVGTWTPHLLYLAIQADADEVVFAGRRMIARQGGGGDWLLRTGKLADGRALPYHFDPEIALRVLAAAKFEVIATDVGSLDDRPVEIVTVHLEGDTARELEQNAQIPTNPFGSGFIGNRRPGGKALVPPKNVVEVDLAFFVDPATKRLLQLRMRAFTQPGMMGGAVVGFARAVGGNGNDSEEEEEEDAETDPKKAAAKPLVFKDGLPVRKKPLKENWNVATVDLRFREHGTAKVPELPAAALTALGLPAPK